MDLAETELRQALAEDPDDAPAHAALAMCLSDQEDSKAGTEEARRAIHLAPDMSFGHYALAYCLNDRNRHEEAETAIREAIRLDPEDADHHALLAATQYGLRRWPAALQAAEHGLRIDPEHIQCTNIRAMALTNLGRNEDAGAAIGTALANDPEDPLSHANMGWTLLHRRQPAEAMTHFREALRLEPGMEWAQAGIVEALKARNPIYRWLLAYFLWMSRLSRKAQWGVILGLYFGYKLVRGVARSNPEIAPWLYPLLIAYVIFALLTWVGEPLFNLLLRFNKFGRLVLSRQETIAANCLAGCLALGVLGAALYWATGWIFWILGGLFAAIMSIPLSSTIRRPAGWPRKLMTGYTSLLATMGGGAVAAMAVVQFWHPAPRAEAMFKPLLAIFIIGLVLFPFVGNFVAMVRVRR